MFTAVLDWQDSLEELGKEINTLEKIIDGMSDPFNQGLLTGQLVHLKECYKDHKVVCERLIATLDEALS